MSDATRTRSFERNQGLEELLAELNGTLGAAEAARSDLPVEPRFPVVLVIGAPRSGTTLLMQWLAASGHFAYPSNLLSRFYQAPYLGARIQQLIADPRFNYKDELGDAARYALPFASDVGKTKGLLQPNEFWYFWRRFIPNRDPDWITPDQERSIDAEGFRRGLAHIEHAFGLPFATKGIILQYNLEALRRALGKVIFIHTRRHPFHNIRSLLQARRNYHGNIETWFSVKPREYEQLKERDPITQVAGQVHYTQVHIEEQLAAMPSEHGLTVDHETFCSSPAAFYARLRAKLAEWDHFLPEVYAGPSHFAVSERMDIDPGMKQAILRSYEDLSGRALRL